MYDLLYSHKKLVQIVLAIIFVPFAFFGVDSYFRAGGGESIATVGGQPVTEQEFALALQGRQNELQRMAGGRMDPALLDSSELRFAVLDGIVRQRLLVSQAVRSGLLVSDQQLQQIISEQPAFQEDGKFSRARYEELLRRQGMTPIGFENSLRRDLMVERVSNAYRATTIVPNAVAERLLRINAQQREVSQSVLAPENFVAQVKLEAGAAKQHYDAHQNEFQLPEQARLEYLVLALDAIAAQVEVSADEVKQFYEQNLKQYARGDERQASHILIAVDAKASAEEKQAARARAEQLLQQARKNPAAFPELARKNSQDPGSAANGGDLGFFPRGAMTKPFDDAVFQMKAGEIAGPVQSEFGYHVIRLTAVKGRGLEEVKQQVALDLKRQKAAKKFSELGEQFNNLVFEQGESLKPAADALKLAIQASSWVSRSGSENKLLNNQKLLQAVFAEDAVKNKRNSEVVDVGNNTLVAARVAEYKPASVRAFEEVSAEITKRLTLQQAAQLAAARGRELLAKLRQGESAAVTWSGAKRISRENAQGYAGPVLVGVFKADVSKLPAYAGIENERSEFVLLKITRVVEAEGVDAARRKAAAEELRQMLGQEEFDAYVTSLKLGADIKVQKERLEKKER
ncbi:MAG: SurA N-terminal domain-containing protein [Betaproteobacteria bacterium]|nr:SurA N-terminal domain-containing protein [Betaproteobacteria bacterium]